MSPRPSPDSARDSLLRELVAARPDTVPWVLFIDRDGVINERVVGDYVRSWTQFQFVPGAIRALAYLSRWAPHLVVVTNQQGVGKGLFSLAVLDDIHRRMSQAIAARGGVVDSVLVCPHLAADGCECRKPGAGLALSWLTSHPETTAGLSVMVGDSDTDMAMAESLARHTGGCVPVRIGSGSEELQYSSLATFADALDAARRATMRP